MKVAAVQAPVSLLMDQSLSASAKVIWMVSRLHAPVGPTGPTLLQTCSGLSRPTTLKGLAQLTAAGWYAAARGERAAAIDRAPAGATVSVPGDLLADRSVGARARVLYGLLQVTPAFQGRSGRVTYPHLSRLVGASPNTVKAAVRELAQAGWLQAAQCHRLAPVRFSLGHPALARSEAEVARVRRRLEKAPFLGEALMREYLSLLVASDHFEDDATPGFLVNPFTDERMQLDRFYPPGVAFEFNGPQHYGPTDRFSGDDAARQRGRDYLKLGICVTRGIELVVVHAADLTLRAMQEKVGDSLPLRDLGGWEPLVDFLRPVSRRYRLAAKRGR